MVENAHELTCFTGQMMQAGAKHWRALSSSPYVVLGICCLSFRISAVILTLQKHCSDPPGFAQGCFSATYTMCLSLLYIKCITRRLQNQRRLVQLLSSQTHIRLSSFSSMQVHLCLKGCAVCYVPASNLGLKSINSWELLSTGLLIF